MRCSRRTSPRAATLPIRPRRYARLLPEACRPTRWTRGWPAATARPRSARTWRSRAGSGAPRCRSSCWTAGWRYVERSPRKRSPARSARRWRPRRVRICHNDRGDATAASTEEDRMLVIGVAGTELTARERDWLQHDACAGVILFTRNFASRAQVGELSAAIREAAPRPQLVCVDQEGGRVQRFREGYSALPPLEVFGRRYAADPEGALAAAREHAWLMASEV